MPSLKTAGKPFCVLVLYLAALLFPPPNQADADAGKEIKNVVIIVLDTLRADHLGIYGYPRNTSPNLDWLARRGVVFQRAIAQAGHTKASVPTIFTSTYPGVHGTHSTGDRLPGGLATMAEIFQSNGYFTVGLVNNIHLYPGMNFERGFNVYQVATDDDIITRLRSLLTKGYLYNQEPIGLGPGLIARMTTFLKDAQDQNLVNHPGFESGREGWAGKADWIADEGGHSGSHAARLDKAAFPDQEFWHLEQTLRLKSGCDYLVGAWVKTKNLRSGLSLEIFEKGNDQHPYTPFGFLQGTNDWTLLLGIFRPGYSDDHCESKVVIRPARIKDFQEGEFWIDDVFVICLSEHPHQDRFRPAGKLFVYAHFLDPHTPHHPPDPCLELFTQPGKSNPWDGYDAEIRAIDDKLGLFLETLDRDGVLDETLLIITADHGEAFGEHGEYGHNNTIYFDEVARVPLIISNPRLFPQPARFEGTVQASADLLPSLVELLGLQVPAGTMFQGESCFPFKRPRSPYAFFYQAPYVKMVTDRKWKYVSGKLRSWAGEREVRGEKARDGGTELTVIDPAGERSAVFATEEELIKSDFYRSLDPKAQEGIITMNKALNPAQPAGGARQEALLFDLENDPGEKINVIDRYPEIARQFQRRIDERFAADRDYLKKNQVAAGGKAEITDSMREQLRTLGYVQ